MAENALMTFVRGLKQLKEHPVLFAPEIFNSLTAVSFVLLFNFLVRLDLADGSSGIFSSVLSVIFIILIMLLSSFTTAGSIGMSKEVVEKGETSYRQLFYYGEKYVLKLVFATVFITLIRLAGALFWTPVIHFFSQSEYTASFVLQAIQTDPDLLRPILETLSVLVIFAVAASTIYFLLVSFMFYFISYIIVIDDMKVFKSYRTSFKLMRQRPARVLSFVILVTAIETLVTLSYIFMIGALGYIGLPIYFGFLIYIVGSLFLAAAMSIWVTRFYMILTKKDVMALPKK